MMMSRRVVENIRERIKRQGERGQDPETNVITVVISSPPPSGHYFSSWFRFGMIYLSCNF
jgi:hypothetical protein